MSKLTRPKKPKIIAVTNQKGGVGKTTTAINLGAELAAQGFNALIVDIDPQGNASTGVGIDAKNRELTTYDLLIENTPLQEVMVETETEGLWIAPSTTDLSSADIDLVANEKRSHMLRHALRNDDVADLGLDYILVDCPPSLSLLTINAMVAADTVLVPLQSEFFALEGLSQLMLSLREVREAANPDLRIEGVVLTMYDQRNNLSHQVEADARENLGDLVFSTVIPRNVRLSEAPSYAMPVSAYDSTSKGSVAYAALAQEILARQ